MTTPANTARRAILGIPYDPAKKPEPRLTVQAFDEMQAVMDAVTAGALAAGTRAELFAIDEAAPHVAAWVSSDPVAAYNGIYANVGTLSAPNFVRKGDLPVSAIALDNLANANPNAVWASATLPIPAAGRAVIYLPILSANTGPMTLQIAGVVRPLVTMRGAPLGPNAVVPGMTVPLVFDGTSYRMLLAAADGAAIEAAGSAATALQAAAVAQMGNAGGLAEFETRALAEAWPGVDPMPQTVVIRGDLTSEDGLGGVFSVGFASEDVMTVNGEAYGRVTKAVSTYPQHLTDDEQEQALTNLGLRNRYWGMQPIGVPIPVFSHLFGVVSDALPPKNNPLYRYILLSAGYTASGRYNDGAISEVVSGTFPAVVASASIILPSSPLLGKSVSLINTEGRSLLAGSTAGAQRLDQFQGFVMGSTSDDSGANTTYGRAAIRDSRPTGTSTPGNSLPVMSPAIASSTWRALNDGVNGEIRQGSTTHGKDITAVYVMRIF